MGFIFAVLLFLYQHSAFPHTQATKPPPLDRPLVTTVQQDPVCPFIRGQEQEVIAKLLKSSKDVLAAIQKDCAHLAKNAEELNRSITQFNEGSSARTKEARDFLLKEVQSSTQSILALVEQCEPVKRNATTQFSEIITGLSALSPTFGVANTSLVVGGGITKSFLEKIGERWSSSKSSKELNQQVLFNEQACLYLSVQRQAMACPLLQAKNELTKVKSTIQEQPPTSLEGLYQRNNLAYYLGTKDTVGILELMTAIHKVKDWNPTKEEVGPSPVSMLSDLMKKDIVDPTTIESVISVQEFIKKKSSEVIADLKKRNEATSNEIHLKDSAEQLFELISLLQTFSNPMLNAKQRLETQVKILTLVQGDQLTFSPRLNPDPFFLHWLGKNTGFIEKKLAVSKLERTISDLTKVQDNAQRLLNQTLIALTENLRDPILKNLKTMPTARQEKAEEYFRSSVLPHFRMCLLLPGALHLKTKSKEPLLRLSNSDEYQKYCAPYFCSGTPPSLLDPLSETPISEEKFKSLICSQMAQSDTYEATLKSNFLGTGSPCGKEAQKPTTKKSIF